MTFIQPKKSKSFLNKAIIILATCLILGVIWLVVVYNRFVNLSHGISGTRADFQSLESQNAELKDQIIELIDSANSGNIVSKNNLVQDKNPKYFEVASQWSYASEY